MAAHLCCERRRDGTRRLSRVSPPAPFSRRVDRQHLLGCRMDRHRIARPLQCDEGGRAGAHARHGGRPPARGNPGQLRQPGNGRHTLGTALTGGCRRPRRRTRCSRSSAADGPPHSAHPQVARCLGWLFPRIQSGAATALPMRGRPPRRNTGASPDLAQRLLRANRQTDTTRAKRGPSAGRPPPNRGQRTRCPLHARQSQPAG